MANLHERRSGVCKEPECWRHIERQAHSAEEGQGRCEVKRHHSWRWSSRRDGFEHRERLRARQRRQELEDRQAWEQAVTTLEGVPGIRVIREVR